MALSKKAIMGIDTLIIFIATILVAAVAAGVIISTSGVLQQKSLIIGAQAQNRLINGIEVTHIFAQGDTENKTANNFEILARPEPAAGPLNFKTTSLTFFTNNGAYAAELEDPSTIDANYSVSVNVLSSFVPFGDLDGDGVTDYVKLQTDGGAANDTLAFNLSDTGLSDNISLGYNADAAALSINITDVPITGNSTIYGYVHIEDASTTGGQIDSSTMRITDVFVGTCTFDNLIPETKYCIVTLVGNHDHYLQYGETKFMYFKLKGANVLIENDEFEFKIFPQDGRSTYLLARVPSVIYKRRINLYP